MRNAAALADKKERSARLEAEFEAKQRARADNRHGVIYADRLCQRLLFRTATPGLCRSKCRAADRAKRKRRRDER